MLDGLAEAMTHLKAAGCRVIYINGSFVTAKIEPNDFDACWDIEEDIDFNYLRINAPVLLKFFDRAALTSKYQGEIYPSQQPVGNYGIMSLDFFQRDRDKNRKGLVAIDLIRWEP